MTDRLKGCVVTFDRDIRDDDAQPLLDAIRQLRGVADVKTSVYNVDDHMNRTRVRLELEDKLHAVLARERV